MVAIIVEKIKRRRVFNVRTVKRYVMEAKTKPFRGWRFKSWPVPGKIRLRRKAKVDFFQRERGLGPELWVSG